VIISTFVFLALGLSTAWLFAPAVGRALGALRADARANPQYDMELRVGGTLLVLGFVMTVIIVAEAARRMCIYDLRPRQAGGQHASHSQLPK